MSDEKKFEVILVRGHGRIRREVVQPFTDEQLRMVEMALDPIGYNVSRVEKGDGLPNIGSLLTSVMADFYAQKAAEEIESAREDEREKWAKTAAPVVRIDAGPQVRVGTPDVPMIPSATDGAPTGHSLRAPDGTRVEIQGISAALQGPQSQIKIMGADGELVDAPLTKPVWPHLKAD